MKNYKDIQQEYRKLSKPRILEEDEWSELDKEFMSKATFKNRKFFRMKHPDHSNPYTGKRYTKKGYRGGAKRDT